MNTPLSPEPIAAVQRKKRQTHRNLAVFFVLLGFVVLVYAVTIIKIKLGYGL